MKKHAQRKQFTAADIKQLTHVQLELVVGGHRTGQLEYLNRNRQKELLT